MDKKQVNGCRWHTSLVYFACVGYGAMEVIKPSNHITNRLVCILAKRTVLAIWVKNWD